MSRTALVAKDLHTQNGFSILGAKEGRDLVIKGEIKPSEWLEACLSIIEKFDSKFKCWEYVNREVGVKIAQKLDEIIWSHSKPFPALAGIPIGLKDIFNTKDMPTGMGSIVRKDYFPGNDARIVEWACILGAQVLGKTKTAEFAVHTPPDTENPWNMNHIAGTSSTGSAVAVACGMAPVAFGTQSGASVIRPASYNGVIGFKPSFGLIPRTGVLKTCDTLDTIGWMTRNVEDSLLFLDSLRVRGHNYPMVERGLSRFADVKKQWKIGVLKAPGFENFEVSDWEKLTQWASKLSMEADLDVAEIDLQDKLKDIHNEHKIIYHKSLSYYFTRELGHIENISGIFKDITEEGNDITPEQYLNALKRQAYFTQQFDDYMEDFDFLITFSVAGEAPLKGELEPRDGSLIWTYLGIPVINLPFLKGKNGLPLGLSLIGKKYSDYQLLSLAKRLFPGNIERPISIEEN